jgi:hypothetical protein
LPRDFDGCFGSEAAVAAATQQSVACGSEADREGASVEAVHPKVVTGQVRTTEASGHCTLPMSNILSAQAGFLPQNMKRVLLKK